jgi:hypothetical protein
MAAVFGSATELSARARPGWLRWFFVAYALWCALMAALGFGETYVAASVGAFEISLIGHLHGALMTVWLALFAWQAVLAARGNVGLHRRFGPLIALYALVIWVSLWVATASSLMRFDESVMTFLYDVLIVQFMLIVLFPTLFIWALLERRRSGSHGRLMALATAVLVQAGIDRIGWLPTFGLPGFWSNSLAFLLLMVGPILVLDFMMRRRIHPTTLGALGLIGIVHIVGNLLWGSSAWRPIAIAITEIVS